MNRKIYRSKGFVYAFALLFIFLITAEAMPKDFLNSIENEGEPVVRVKRAGKRISAQQIERFEELFTEGKRLLQEEYDYDSAIEKFTESLRYAPSSEHRADVYIYLSLAYYATIEVGGQGRFVEALKELIALDYDRDLDRNICPPKYIERYEEIKQDYGGLKIISRPAGADVYLDGSRTSVGLTPLTIGRKAGTARVRVKKGSKKKDDKIEVVAGKITVTPEYALKGKSSMIFILGGAAALGGIALAVLAGGGSDSGGNGGQPTGPTTGSINVTSSPTGAEVWLDGENTGEVTNTTLTNIQPGSHEIVLQSENYENYTATVSVSAGQTADVNATLDKHTIHVMNPNPDIQWNRDESIEIEWQESGTSLSASSQSSQNQSKFGSVERQESMASLKNRALRSGIDFRNLSLRRRGLISSALSQNGGIPSSVDQNHRTKLGSKSLNRRGDRFDKGLPRINLRPSLIRFFPTGQFFSRQSVTNKSSDNSAEPLWITDVKIELHRGNTQVKTITEKTKNDGYHTWTVGEGLEYGDDYKVMVTSFTDPDVFGESEIFEVGPADLEEDFSSPDTVKYYFTESHPDRWEVEDGAYHYYGRSGLPHIRSTSRYDLDTYSDFIMEANCGNEDHKAYYGLGFRGNDQFTSYYYFYVGSDGTYQLVKRENGEDIYIISERPHSAINTGDYSWNWLKVEAEGNFFTFYVNDTYITEISISDIPAEGKVGLVTKTPWLRVIFDDFSVWVN